MNFGWGGNFGGMPQRFDEQYHCYSMAYAEKGHLEVCHHERDHKVLHVQYPLLSFPLRCYLVTNVHEISVSKHS